MHLSDATPPWPAFVRVKPGELLSSWLCRLAHAHYLKVHTFCVINWPHADIWTRDIDRRAGKDMLLLLAQRTCSSYAQAEASTLTSLESHLFLKNNPTGSTKWVMPLGMQHRIPTKRVFGLQYCPCCLIEDASTPYFRKYWRLSLSIVCPNCKVILHDRCCNCGSPVCFFRQELGKKGERPFGPLTLCYTCKTDLRHAPPTMAPEHLIIYQRWLYRIMEQGYTPDLSYSHLFFDALYHMLFFLRSRVPKAVLLQKAVCKEAGFEYIPQNENERYDSFDKKPVDERIRLIEMARWLLNDWPDRFVNLCSDNRVWSAVLLRDIDDPPYWYWTVITKNLCLYRRYGVKPKWSK